MSNNNIDKKFSEFTEVTSVDENAMIPLIQGVPWYNGIIPAYKFIEALGLDGMLDNLKELYLSKVEDDTAQGKITFEKGIDVNDTLNAKDINAEFIVIEDDGSTEGIIQGVTEFITLTEEEEDTITQILTENVNSSGNLSPLQLTLGGLLNADESFDGVEDGIYGFRKSGGIYYPILIQGEGGVPKILFRIKTITPSNLTVLDEDLSNIEYLWGSVDAVDGTETGVGTLKVIVDDEVVHEDLIEQQNNAIDVTEYISLGSNNVKINVTDSYENTGTLNYQVSLVSSRFYFVDPEVERLLVIEFDKNNDGYLSIAEVKGVTSLFNSLKGSKVITEFNELEEFTNLKVLNADAFSGCVNLSSVKLPSGLTKIEDGAFNNTPLLETIDLSNLDVLTSVNLLNSNFKQVGLNENTIYDKLFLPSTLTNLKLKEQPLLTNSTFKMGGYSNLESIWVEDTPNVDGFQLVSDVLKLEDSKLTNVRLINIDETNKLNELMAISNLRGMNANGVDCPIGEAVMGKAHFDVITQDEFDFISSKLSNVVFTYGIIGDPLIFFEDPEVGRVLHANGLIADPIKTSKRELATITSLNPRGYTTTSYFYNNQVITKFPELKYCTGLSELKYTFSDCSNLINAPTIPNSVTDMTGTFYDCSNLINAPIIPESVTDMTETFFRCYSLVDAPVIPDSVTNMSYTFDGCRSLVNTPIIPNSVTTMVYTFWGCISLIEAPIIPNSVTNMSNTFQGCSNLINAPTIPNSVTNMTATFNGCSSLIEAPIIPEGVTNMISTFAKCTSLVSAPTIPSSVTNMGSTFAECEALIEAPIIPYSVTNMYATFRDCTSLVEVGNIPNSVTDMYRIFKGCTSLVEVGNISNSVTNMDEMFFDCTSLIEAPIIPNSVTTMVYTFYNCSSLVNAPTIPNSVTDMTGTLNQCSSLVSAPIIHNSVTKMDYTFYNCSSLDGIFIIKSVTPPTYYNTFQYVNIVAIYVPDGSVNSYKTTSRWSSHSSKIYPMSSIGMTTRLYPTI